MFKTINKAWEARTPKILHHGSKQNIIFQLSLVVLIVLGLAVKDKKTRAHEAELHDIMNKHTS